MLQILDIAQKEQLFTSDKTNIYECYNIGRQLFFGIYIIFQRLQHMVSAIKLIVDQYKKKVLQQNDWSLTSQLKRQQTVISKKAGSYFLSIILTMLLDENDVQISNQNQLEKHKKKLLQWLRIRYKQEGEVLERILGMFIMQFVRKDDKLNNIYNELDINFEVEQLSQDSMDLNSEDEDNQTSIYSLPSHISKINSQEMKNNYNKLVEEQSFVNFIDYNIQDKIHQNTVNEYITKLSAPQTEITYICQHFGWRSSFKDKHLSNGNFQVTASVDFQFKNFKKELTTNAQFKNKKIARMLSSAKLLRSLYISFPQIWSIYSKIRNEKSLIIPEDHSNSYILQKAIKDEKVEIVKVNKRNQEEFEKQLYQYLGQISSFKSQMNILLQQISGMFTHPKMEKMQFDNKWKVKGELFMKINSTGETKQYMEIEINTNSKQAEQIVAKKILSKMYLQNKEILETMAILKKKKGFKT